MTEEPLSAIMYVIAAFAAAMYPLGFLFGACSPCCQQQVCSWGLNLERCLRVSITGSSPADGGDCVQSLHQTSFDNSKNSLFVGARDFQNAEAFEHNYSQGSFIVWHLPSALTASIGVTLSSSGNSRTPVGETRSQVWRLLRAAQNPTTPYDVIGPPWYLQVELTVTGVLTDEEAGVESSFGEDEHGQPKLILSIRQGASIFRSGHTVEMAPIGLQRWLPLSSANFLPSLVSGSPYSGWGLQLAGVTYGQRAIAVEVPSDTEFCNGLGRTTERKVILNDINAAAFVNGEFDIQILARDPQTGVIAQRTLRLTERNVLCGSASMSAGVALGIYPEKIYLQVPQSFYANLPTSNAMWCGDSTITLRAGAGRRSPTFVGQDLGCMNSWGPAFYGRRGVVIHGYNYTGLPTVSSFWPGRTLLWNLASGPYRTSFTSLGPNGSAGEWVYSLSGSSPSEPYENAFCGGCPPGMSPANQLSIAGNASYDLCLPSVPYACGNFTCYAVYTTTAEYEATYDYLEEAKYIGGLDWEVKVKQKTAGGSLAINMKLMSTAATASVPPSVFFVGSEAVTLRQTIRYAPSPDVPSVELVESGVGFSVGVQTRASVTCDASGEFTPEISLLSVTGNDGVLGFPGSEWTQGAVSFEENRTKVIALLSRKVSVSIKSQSVPFASGRRLVCSSWDSETVPGTGAKITRTCSLSDGSSVPQGAVVNPGLIGATRELPVTSLTVPASPSFVPRSISVTPQDGTPISSQDENCKLLECLPLSTSIAWGAAFGRDTPGLKLVFRLPVNSCHYLVPIFGSGRSILDNDAPCGWAYTTALPCNNCQVQVAQTFGFDSASVRLVESGDRAGLIEIVIKRLWVAGERIEFTVSCGEVTIQQTVRSRTSQLFD